MGTVFVTGATGVIGRHAIAELLAAGHAVRGLARNADRADAVAETGAQPVVGDIYDVDAMTRAIAGCDTVVHLATRIPPMTRARSASAWAENTKLRAVATGVLVDAALANGVARFVAESITFIYADGGSTWLDEHASIDAPVALQSVLALERAVERFSAGGGAGITLRFAALYGRDARSTDEFLRAARWKVAPALGDPDGYVSSIETRDAGRAVAASLRAPAGVYNVGDDGPLTRRELTDAFAAAFGLKHLRILPAGPARATGGPVAVALLRSQRVRNGAFTAATGWTPKATSATDGWNAIATARRAVAHV